MANAWLGRGVARIRRGQAKEGRADLQVAAVQEPQRLGAGAVWLQSGVASDGTKTPHGCWMDQEASQEARAIVESAGLRYVESPYIADEARRLGEQ